MGRMRSGQGHGDGDGVRAGGNIGGMQTSSGFEQLGLLPEKMEVSFMFLSINLGILHGCG